MDYILKHIIIINGGAGVGKDTFVEAVRDVHNNTVLNYSSVDDIKRIAIAAGWDGIKNEKSRKFLSELKVLCDEFNDLTFKSMERAVSRFQSSFYKDNSLLFLHIREPKNIERAKEAFNAVTVLVVRDSVAKITSNQSDASVYEYDYDFIVDNNHTLDRLHPTQDHLHNEARRFLKYLGNIR